MSLQLVRGCAQSVIGPPRSRLFFAPQQMRDLSRFEVNSSQTFAAGGGQGWSEGVPLGRFGSAQGYTALWPNLQSRDFQVRVSSRF